MNPEKNYNQPPSLPPSIEELKEKYKNKLEGILHKTLTVENIDTFADEALEELVMLINDVLDEYNRNEALKPNLDLNKREQEDDAFNKLGLLNIQDTLQRVIEVKDKIDALKVFVSSNKNAKKETFIPPQSGIVNTPDNSGEGLEEKKLVPRLITLLYLLETDFDIQKEDVSITEGGVTSHMMRKTPYVRAEIPDMERIVYICDEEDNASYIFDSEKLVEYGIEIEDIDVRDKGNLKDILARYPGIGARLIQTKYWRSNVAELLSQPITENANRTSLPIEKEGQPPTSEFAKVEKIEFVDLGTFREEVKSLYPGEGDIRKWYKEEKSKHKNWPAHPERVYKNEGWIGFPELIGKENRLKKEYPSFEIFQQEVIALYPGKGNVQSWYMKERSHHKNWTSNPNIIYKDSGWLGWSELVNKENRLKKEYLPFDAFQADVKSLYPGEGGVKEWYDEERRNHFNWPSMPNIIYKNKGWLGFPELVGKENDKKLEYLPFDAFKTEVQGLYNGEFNVLAWYKIERLKHKNWPSKPEVTYKDDGWSGWPKLVGKEYRFMKEFLPFDAFRTEVRGVYKGESNIDKWYKEEKSKHENWPASPNETYKNRGWKGYIELVGK